MSSIWGFSNRILAEKEIARHHELLRQRIKEPTMKGVDNSPPKEYPHLKANRKGKQAKIDRDEAIKKDNHSILSRVGSRQSKQDGRVIVPGTREERGRAKIDNHLSPRGISHTRGEAVPQPSLNYVRRKREAERIAEGNAKLLDHITKTRGCVNREDMEKDHIRSRDYLSLLSQRPVGEPGSLPSNSKNSPREPAFGRKHFITSRTTLNAGSSVLSSARSRTSRSKKAESTGKEEEKHQNSAAGSPSAQHDMSQDLGEDKNSILNDSDGDASPTNSPSSRNNRNITEGKQSTVEEDDEKEKTKGDEDSEMVHESNDRTQELFADQDDTHDETQHETSQDEQHFDNNQQAVSDGEDSKPSQEQSAVPRLPLESLPEHNEKREENHQDSTSSKNEQSNSAGSREGDNMQETNDDAGVHEDTSGDIGGESAPTSGVNWYSETPQDRASEEQHNQVDAEHEGEDAEVHEDTSGNIDGESAPTSGVNWYSEFQQDASDTLHDQLGEDREGESGNQASDDAEVPEGTAGETGESGTNSGFGGYSESFQETNDSNQDTSAEENAAESATYGVDWY